jgi:hypothetical protein
LGWGFLEFWLPPLSFESPCPSPYAGCLSASTAERTLKHRQARFRQCGGRRSLESSLHHTRERGPRGILQSVSIFRALENGYVHEQRSNECLSRCVRSCGFEEAARTHTAHPGTPKLSALPSQVSRVLSQAARYSPAALCGRRGPRLCTPPHFSTVHKRGITRHGGCKGVEHPRIAVICLMQPYCTGSPRREVADNDTRGEAVKERHTGCWSTSSLTHRRWQGGDYRGPITHQCRS